MNASRLTGVSDAMIFQQPRVVPNVNALTDSAETALCAGDRAKGRLLLHGALSHFPNDPQALTLMAWLLEEDGQPEEGTQFLRRAVAADPRAERIFAFASHLKRHVSPEHAIEELQALPSAVRTRGQLGLVYASALAQVGRHAEEIATYRLMLKQDPQNPDIWLHLANALRSVHQTSDAIRAVKRAIQLRPTFGPAYWTLANLKTYSFTAEELSRMRDLVSRTLPLEDALALHFALGKAHEDAEQFATSFQHYATGNLLRAKTLDPSKVAITSKVDSLIAHCSREVFMRAADAGCPADDPIFIVGLHRSGSTLVEQILASHPLIEGTGELKAMHTLARRLQSFATHTFGETLARLSTSDLVSIGEEYLQNTRASRRTDRPFFTDKLPANWLNIPLIRLALPRAKIIDARRHPMACGFSNFRQNYAAGVAHSYDLRWMGEYYRDYLRFMRSFQDQQPGASYTVINENLIEDPQGETRRLLEYVGVPNSQSCLDFFENDRAVRTPSAEQVRRPFNRDGVDKWRSYEPWLGELKSALGDALDLWES